MKANGGQSRQPFVSAKAVGLAAACLAGALAAGWVAADIGIRSGIRGSFSGPMRASAVLAAQGSGQWSRLSPSPVIATTPVTNLEFYQVWTRVNDCGGPARSIALACGCRQWRCVGNARCRANI